MRLLFIFLLTVLNNLVYSQNIFRLNVDTISSKDLLFQKSDDTLIISKKKKKKKNIFFGVKTKKGFIRTTSGRNNIFENFYYIKNPDIKNKYAQEIFFYDKKKKSLIKSKSIKNEALMLHGPYLKRLNNQIIEEGMFYFGLKQNRWIRLNRSDILQEKENYSLGWLDESIRYYWDYEKQNLKELIPLKFGEKNGTYYAFHLNGSLAAQGKYLHDRKVGTWVEFYKSGMKKREIKYDESPFNINNAYIVREWNLNGKLVYDRSLYLRKIN